MPRMAQSTYAKLDAGEELRKPMKPFWAILHVLRIPSFGLKNQIK